MRLLGFALFFFAVASSAGARRAAADDLERTAAARSLFEEGVRLAEAGEWRQAADRFERTLALRDSPVVAFNLATARVRLGELLAASELLRRVIRDPATSDEVRGAARADLRRVERRIAQVTLVLEGDAAGVDVSMDGRPFPTARIGVPTLLDPGAHHLEAHRGGAIVVATDVSLGDGARRRLTLEIPPAGAPVRRRVLVMDTTSTRDEADDESVLASPWTWILGGVVIVGAGVAIAATAGSGGESVEPVEGTLGRINL